MSSVSPVFDQLFIAEESTPGTGETTMEHRFGLNGHIKHQSPPTKIRHNDGSRAQNSQSEILKQWGEISASGAATVDDVYYALRALLDDPTTSSPETDTDLHVWTPAVVTDADAFMPSTLMAVNKSQTVKPVKSGSYGIVQQVVFTNDASGANVAQLSLNAKCNYPVDLDLTGLVFPSIRTPVKFHPLKMQMWLDTSSVIGTTELAGRIVKVTHTIMNGVQELFVPIGASADVPDYSNVAYGLRAGVKTDVQIRLATDSLLSDVFKEYVKLRVRHNAEALTNGFAYLEVDTYGKLTVNSRDTVGDNVTAWNISIEGELDVTLGSDCRIALARRKPA